MGSAIDQWFARHRRADEGIYAVGGARGGFRPVPSLPDPPSSNRQRLAAIDEPPPFSQPYMIDVEDDNDSVDDQPPFHHLQVSQQLSLQASLERDPGLRSDMSSNAILSAMRYDTSAYNRDDMFRPPNGMDILQGHRWI